jgi:hypothetical protein
MLIHTLIDVYWQICIHRLSACVCPVLYLFFYFFQPGLLAGGNNIVGVTKPEDGSSGLEVAFYPWGGALKKTNPRMTK